MYWRTIDKDNFDTYPTEGINVLVSDGIHHDVAYFIKSQTYKWFKVNLKLDDANEFDEFEITKWAYITENQNSERIQQLETASLELFNMVHDSDSIENKIRANELYDIIKPQP